MAKMEKKKKMDREEISSVRLLSLLAEEAHGEVSWEHEKAPRRWGNGVENESRTIALTVLSMFDEWHKLRQRRFVWNPV